MSKMRQRTTDWINAANNVVESYPLGIAHGLQKDAIQNGWDACEPKTKAYVSSHWKMRFELAHLGKRRLLLIQDVGTTGLTGSKISEDFRHGETPPETERWAKWESFASGKTSVDSLGERGQGKMLYIASSKDHELYYESLRSDGTYRAGWTKASHSDCPLSHWEEDEGRRIIQDRLGLTPITEQGSRFIVIEPLDEIVDAIMSGAMSDNIAETWWPLVLKQGGTIEVKSRSKSFLITTPPRYPIESDHADSKVWIKEGVKVTYKNEQYTIKRIALSHSTREIPEGKQGVGVYRAGMQVPTLAFTRREFRPFIYGYVELGNEIDRELKEQHLESPNHYDFRDTGLWRKVKYAIEDEMEAFVNQRLLSDESDEQKQRNQRSTAENRALALLRSVIQGWPLSETGLGPIEPSPGLPTHSPKKQGVQLSNFLFPNPSNMPRLNYGQTIEGYFLTAFNKSDQEMEAEYSIKLLSGDRLIETVDKGLIKVAPHSVEPCGEAHRLEASPDLFPVPGSYRLKITLLDPTQETKPIIDTITRIIWIEDDPKLKAPFDIVPSHFSEYEESGIPLKSEWFLAAEGSGRYKFYYNLDHPTYLRHEGTETGQTRYLSEIFAAGALDLLIQRLRSVDADELSEYNSLPFDVSVLQSGKPDAVYRETMMAMSKIKFDIDSEV